MKHRINLRLSILVVFILALLASAGGAPGGAEAASCAPPEGLFAHARAPAPGALVPPSLETVLDSEGREISVSGFAGRGLVMNFWASWCAPCIREMPALNAARPLLAPDGIEVIAVSEDRAPETAARTMAEHGWDNLPLLTDPGSRLLRDLKAPGLPFTVLIDAAGREVLRAAGEAEWDAPEVLAFVRACLKPAS